VKDNWQPFQLPDGSYSDPTRPWSQQDLVNYLPMQAEMAGTRSGVLLRTAPGLKLIATLGTGPIRGIRDVEGTRFIVSGTTLYRLNADGSSDDLGTVPGTGPVSMTHNQVAGGNQLVVGNGSSGYIYDTRDDSLRNPVEPEDEPGDNPTAPGGGTPSTGLGPNGGYPDDDEPAIPLPTVFGTDLIDGGDFGSPGDLDDWTDRLGDPLSGWSIVSGMAHYNAIGTSDALYEPARYRMSPWPFPRYSATLTADVSCVAGAKVAIGMYVAYSTNGATPTLLSSSDPTEYLSSTPITHTFDFKFEDIGITANGEYVIPYAIPVMRVFTESGTAVQADFDNVTMEIAEVSTPMTTLSPTNLDFASGLTSWTQYPTPGAGSPTFTVSAGEVTMTPGSEGTFAHIVNDDPLAGAAYNTYVHMMAEAWSNDPTSQSGSPQNGIALGIAIRGPDGVVVLPPRLGSYERGDWTAREAYFRQALSDAAIGDGYSIHACVSFRAKAGFLAKVRNVTVERTTSPVAS